MVWPPWRYYVGVCVHVAHSHATTMKCTYVCEHCVYNQWPHHTSVCTLLGHGLSCSISGAIHLTGSFVLCLSPWLPSPDILKSDSLATRSWETEQWRIAWCRTLKHVTRCAHDPEVRPRWITDTEKIQYQPRMFLAATSPWTILCSDKYSRAFATSAAKLHIRCTSRLVSSDWLGLSIRICSRSTLSDYVCTTAQIESQPRKEETAGQQDWCLP